MDFVSVLVDFLENLSHDPVLYSIVFFIYSIAATTFLPIPIEIGLFFGQASPIWLKALVLGAGKAVGSVLVFILGVHLENPLNQLGARWGWFRKFVELMHKFVAKTRYIGLYIILSIPLMVDTAPLYIFAIFNQEGLMCLRHFALTNFLAGITRAFIVYLIFLYFGIMLV
ncbi:MAG: hypothetical protein GX307_03345 [Euryarchaeota archaeon]|nr:hypothetical protein [Euryarchaeota archaeon]